ncbi:hypothetical protein PHMEG_00018762 [Phytophthora megakarya]|uniref:Uncharacterized protein n=1 Tax=Phytophthora megakarya TaxID=4795 RepID=A0A225VT98_9STRA|nr:hypothetical protein PHMEG_00018762 [Phytophthora megakarya]
MAIATLAPPPVGDGAHTSDASGGPGSDAPATDNRNAPRDTDGNAPDAPAGSDMPGNVDDDTGGSNDAEKGSPAVEEDGAEEENVGKSLPDGKTGDITSQHGSRSPSISSQPTPSVVLGGAHFLSIAESDRICLPGVIPSSMASLSMGAPVVPVTWDVPPSFDSAAERHIVGVPATETSLQCGSRMCNGCGGGLETPLLFESVSSEDLVYLEGLLG